jgi:choline dehydrogenase-like flavoprotein
MVDKSADVVVVGGGSAGCAMAGRLAQAGIKVLLIEAGKSDNHLSLKVPGFTRAVVHNPSFDWMNVAEPDPSIGGRADVWPAGKRLGGGSAINGMIYVRGHAWDYDNWVRLGAKGWSYADCVPYFRRSETNSRGEDAYRGGSGPVSVSDARVHYPILEEWMEAAVSKGIPRTDDHNGRCPGEGTDYAQATQRQGLRCSATGYLRLPDARPHIEVLTEAHARRILIEGGRAVGVEFDYRGSTQRAHARAGVVLSAGAINSPRLLMLSGVGPAAHLQQMGVRVELDLPGVGRNLQEHVGTHLISDVNTPTINSDVRGLAAIGQGLSFLLRRRGALTTSFAHAQTFVHTRAGLSAPNMQISFTLFAFDLINGHAELRPNPSVTTTICRSRPGARGSIELRSADPYARALIRHRLLDDPDDCEQIAEAIELSREILAQPSIRHAVVNEARPGKQFAGRGLRDYVRMASFPMYHPVGTCRMGTDAMSVVDPDLRLHGINGLWVTDCSVIPSLPSGNTNATAIMIGDKGSDHVLRALRGGGRADATRTVPRTPENQRVNAIS